MIVIYWRIILCRLGSLCSSHFVFLFQIKHTNTMANISDYIHAYIHVSLYIFGARKRNEMCIPGKEKFNTHTHTHIRSQQKKKLQGQRGRVKEALIYFVTIFLCLYANFHIVIRERQAHNHSSSGSSQLFNINIYMKREERESEKKK